LPKINSFLKNGKLNKTINDILSQGDFQILEKIQKSLRDNNTSILDQINKLYPSPNPDIKNKLMDDFSSLIANLDVFVMLRKDALKYIETNLPKKEYDGFSS
jgi:regulator of sigma D